MPDNTYKCGKCSSEMNRGFIADRSDASYMQTLFVEGEPEHAQLFGIRGDNLNVSGKTLYPLRALRCSRCGYVEIYAV
jgi:DNA-directed RNA polymerase subunit RPC12/RpoP